MAAWINVLREEGTKQDCLDQAIKLWEENLELRAALQEIVEESAICRTDNSKQRKHLGDIASTALKGKK
jgi:regulator of replication initiation timing